MASYLKCPILEAAAILLLILGFYHQCLFRMKEFTLSPSKDSANLDTSNEEDIACACRDLNVTLTANGCDCYETCNASSTDEEKPCPPCPNLDDNIPDIDCGNVGDQNFAPDVAEGFNGNYGKTQHYLVPNIVHYTWFVDKPEEFVFEGMLSILSAEKFIKPDAIYFHTNMEPIGQYWDEVKKIKSLKVIYRKPTLCLFGEPVKQANWLSAQSNIERLRILHETGGIYFDLDVLVIKSFDVLRKYPCTIGLEMDDKVCSGIIVCSRGNIFITLWLNSFLDNFRHTEWTYNTGILPYKYTQRYPHLIHVEKNTLHYPSWGNLNALYGNKSYNWKRNFAIHLWRRNWRESEYFTEEPNYENIKVWNNTFAAIARRILNE